MGIASRINEKVVFICGAGHSGSTLLGMILGSHTQSFYCGEGNKSSKIHQQKGAIKKRVCKLCGFDCPIWQDFPFSNDLDLYEQLSIKTKKPIVVDSCKNLNWLELQLETLKNTPVEPFLIFLQRDGRATINSWLRKSADEDAKEIIYSWMTQIKNTTELFDKFAGKKVKIQYEKLATEPEAITKMLCDWIEIDYQPEMLKYYQHEHHPLGGNSGTQFLVVRSQGEKLQNSMVDKPDQQKQELDPTVEQLFEEIASDVNAEMKWEA
jgi:hypothetical protein